jgi:FkbM family methyltransferase
VTACVLAAVLVAAALSSERVRWRLDALALKASGNLPVRTWPEVVRGLFRCDALPCIDTIVRSPVTIARYDTDNPCPVLWKTPFGPMRGFIEDHHVLEHFTTRSWIVDPAAPRVAAGSVVLEIGAWLGSFTRSALNQGASRVIAFEPVPSNRACFEQNFAAEIAAGRVTVVAKAAWDEPGPVKMANVGPSNEAGSNKGFLVWEDGPVDAEAATIDSVIEQLGLERIDFVNMDIEGNEPRALQGARNTIQKFRPLIVICIHHQPGDREKIPRAILDIEPGYEVETTQFQGYFRPLPVTASSSN